jgi:large-conductance mechanosensitive channel
MEGNMKFDYNLLILLLINFFLLFIVIGVIFNVVRGYKAHVDRNKKIEQKFDEILNEFIIKTLNNSK